MAERANYPADVSKLRTLLLALSDTKIREEKTSNPASYSIIGVEDPTKPGATGAQIDLTAKDGKHGVIVGKSVAGGNFVRRAGENTSYVVEPGITFEAEPRYWIDTRLLDIASDKIQSIEFKPATGPAYSVRRVVEPSGKAPDAKAPCEIRGCQNSRHARGNPAAPSGQQVRTGRRAERTTGGGSADTRACA